jgi:hypothetical protein
MNRRMMKERWKMVREACRRDVEEMRAFEIVPPPPYKLRRGRRRTYPKKCYERAYRYIVDHDDTDARLMHGRYYDGKGHAWVVIPGGIVFDGVLDRFYAAEPYLQMLECVPEKEYSAQEAITVGGQHRHYGPWHGS